MQADLRKGAGHVLTVANWMTFYQHLRMNHESDIRRLRYRLNRQGMLELDAWLTPLEKALTAGNDELLAQVEVIIATDTPELLAMMHGEIPVPESLRPWLEH
ncbi:MAG: succinate dehydrogenase assembly factor 2 [Mariprofundaceae bacterium]